VADIVRSDRNALTVEQKDPLLVALVGPTASGKTALSLALAGRFGGEIVSCDSVAVYRELNIGTAKPTPEERARVPHHLLDVVSITEFMTAGDYARRARAVLEDIRQRGHLPIVVGGTGLYLRALLEGLFPGPERSEDLRERLRERVRRRGSPYIHRILARLDPEAAVRIHPNDAPKLIRAIEVCLAPRSQPSGCPTLSPAFGERWDQSRTATPSDASATYPVAQSSTFAVSGPRTLTALWQRGRNSLRGFRILRIGLNPDRQELYERINQRASQMFDVGLLEETSSLLQSYAADRALIPRPLQSLGYVQATEFLRGEKSLEEAVAAAQQGHRNYAKRQLTWFRREPDVHWLAGFGDDPAVQSEAIALVGAAREG
jgi:tRNA dimethylallyltransferase